MQSRNITLVEHALRNVIQISPSKKTEKTTIGYSLKKGKHFEPQTIKHISPSKWRLRFEEGPSAVSSFRDVVEDVKAALVPLIKKQIYS